MSRINGNNLAHRNRQHLERLKILKGNVNWEIEEQRVRLIYELYPLTKDYWMDQLRPFRDIFQSKEIDRLLLDVVECMSHHELILVGFSLINFLIRIGYKDEPDLDEDGKPSLSRTTPIHPTVKLNKLSRIIVASRLFKVYHRFDLNYTDESGLTHFHVACMYDCDEVVQKFLELGQDPNCLWSETGDSPLHLASSRKVAELLLRSGSNPNSTNANGMTPLHSICSRYQSNQLVEEFFEVCDDIHQTVQIDARDNKGTSPLQVAVKGDYSQAVEFLLRRGADPTLADSEGWTVLHSYNLLNDCRLVEILFEISEEKHRKVEVNAQDNEGNTPLHLAMHCTVLRSEEAIKSLLRHGANPNMPNKEGWTPLHLICRRKDDYGSVETFFKMCNENNQQVKVDAKDKLGRTPLQWAVARSWPNVVHVLLDHGADLSNFVFPTASLFDEIIMGFKHINSILKLQLISGALSVIETLEKRGYELQQSNVVTIMKVFTNNVFLKKSVDLGKSLCDDKEFVETAKQILITPKTLHCNKCGNEDEEKDEDEEDEEVIEETKIVESSSLSLYDLISSRPEEVTKVLTYMNYYDLTCFQTLDQLHTSRSRKYCALHLFEKLSRQFFRNRTVYPFWELIHKRLPIECCDIIIEELKNEDLLSICLAAADQSHKDNKKM